nr:unnamed protein product [Haemonchus contortus]
MRTVFELTDHNFSIKFFGGGGVVASGALYHTHESTTSDAVEEEEENKYGDEKDVAKASKQEDLFCEASSLHEKMLMFSKELNTLIKRRKRTDDECRQTALEISVSP